MKRVGLLLATGAVILGSAASAWAQAAAPPAFTVTFNGQARVVGAVSDNVTDFVDWTTACGPARAVQLLVH